MLKKQYLKSKEICKVTFSCSPPTNLFDNPVCSIELRGNFPEESNIGWKKGIKMRKSDSTYPRWEIELNLPTGLSIEFRYVAKDLHGSCAWLSEDMADDEVTNEYGSTNSVLSTFDDDEQLLPTNYW